MQMRNIKYATCCLVMTMLVGCSTKSASVVGNQRYETIEVATTATQEPAKETEEETYTVAHETTASAVAPETTASIVEETEQKVPHYRIDNMYGDYVPELERESSLIDMPGYIVWRAGVEFPTNAVYKLNYVLNNNEEGITIDRESSAVYVDSIDYGFTSAVYHLKVRTASDNWELKDVTLTTLEDINVVEYVYRDFSNMYIENSDYDFHL